MNKATAVSAVSRLKSTALVVGMSLAPFAAMAQEAGEFDPAPIAAKIVVFTGTVTLLIGAMIGARWGKHLFGLLSPKG